MSDNAVQRKEFQFPTRVYEAHEQLDSIDHEIKRLESMKKQLRKFLAKSIPVNPVEGEEETKMEGEVDGVRRLQFRQTRVSYSSVLTRVRETIVPKTKQDEVDKIIEEESKEMWVDRFSFSRPEESVFGEE